MSEKKSELTQFDRFVSYLPHPIILLGLFGNTACFLIFRLSKEFNQIPSMVYLSFIAILDTLSLFEWNLNHFLSPNFNIELEYLNVFNCKFFIFIQVFSFHCSANLLSIMCIDRFVTINSMPGSLFSRLPFSTVKSSYIWSISLLVFFFIFNSHLLILNGNYVNVKFKNETEFTINTNGTLISNVKTIKIEKLCYWYSPTYRIYPLLDHINLVVYNLIPFTIMMTFNVLLITKTLLMNKSSKYLNDKEALKAMKKKRRLTISILSITFAFIIMTTPSSIIFGFYYDVFSETFGGQSVLNILDSFAFLYHSSLFLNSLITNVKFRKFVVSLVLQIKKKCFNSFKLLF